MMVHSAYKKAFDQVEWDSLTYQLNRNPAV